MTSGCNISYASLTNKGKRAINEDYLDVLVTPERLAFILCDGLGGHGSGDIASRFVVEQIWMRTVRCSFLETPIICFPYMQLPGWAKKSIVLY